MSVKQKASQFEPQMAPKSWNAEATNKRKKKWGEGEEKAPQRKIPLELLWILEEKEERKTLSNVYGRKRAFQNRSWDGKVRRNDLIWLMTSIFSHNADMKWQYLDILLRFILDALARASFCALSSWAWQRRRGGHLLPIPASQFLADAIFFKDNKNSLIEVEPGQILAARPAGQITRPAGRAPCQNEKKSFHAVKLANFIIQSLDYA